MTIKKKVPLAQYTSFGTGGPAEILAVANSDQDFVDILRHQPQPFWLLGTGANSLVSDHGLPGTTIKIEAQDIHFDHQLAIAEAGANWDELVQQSIAHQLWGLELTSGIPSSVGAAVVGNIAAYGQAVSDTLQWIEVIDYAAGDLSVRRLPANKLDLSYRSSCFSKTANSTVVILRAAFRLSQTPITDLKYESALQVATARGWDTATLSGRRQTIMQARAQAGSLLDAKHHQKTAGSFFKNPVVSRQQAEQIMAHEERAITRQQVLHQNQIHGGQALRVSAAHVLLAAGFKRGQAWGPVRLHPDHILKIENTGGATSQQIYDVAQTIITTVKHKLNLDLTPEVRFLGKFKD